MENESVQDRQWALLSYLLPPLTGLMILFIEDKAERPFLMYHALLSIALGAVGTVLFCIYPLVWLYCIYLGIRAYQGRTVTVPFLSDWIAQQEWAKTDIG
jgi:uncharacterized membrane protein